MLQYIQIKKGVFFFGVECNVGQVPGGWDFFYHCGMGTHMTDNDVKVEPSTRVSFIAHLQKPREADNSDGRKRRKAKTVVR